MSICSICTKIVYKPYFYMPVCHHIFHEKCIKHWIYASGKLFCPLCKTIYTLLDLIKTIVINIMFIYLKDLDIKSAEKYFDVCYAKNNKNDYMTDIALTLQINDKITISKNLINRIFEFSKEQEETIRPQIRKMFKDDKRKKMNSILTCKWKNSFFQY